MKRTRTKPNAECVKLAELYERLSRGGAVEAGDRTMLLGILQDVLGEDDPRERFFEKVRGSREPGHHHVYVALDVHRQADFATAPKRAIDRVAKAWRMAGETVRAIERRYRDVKAPAGIGKIVDCQRARWLERDSKIPPTRRSR